VACRWVIVRPSSKKSLLVARSSIIAGGPLDERADRLRQEVAAWSALLEAELGPQIPAAEEAEGPAAETETAGSVP
jgi:hypothetical protein